MYRGNQSNSISVIVPVYNEGQNLEELVQYAGTLCGFLEWIIVDASDETDSMKQADQLRKLISNDSRKLPIKLISNKQPGRAIQMNLGAAHSSGEILLFLHCDTRLPINAAELVRSAMDSNFDWGRFDVQLATSGAVFRLIEKMINLRSRVRNLATGDQAIFLRKSIFLDSGGFPEIPLMEDIALSKALNHRSPPALISSPVTTSARRWQNRGPLRTILLMWKLRFLFWIGVPADRLAKSYQHER